MTQILQLEEARVIEQKSQDTPRLLVEWSSRWEEFRSCIGPALARSEARLAGEAPFGLVPFRIMVPSYVLEGFLIFAFIAIQVKIQQLRPYVVPRMSTHDVIYYSGDELPRTEDLGGAETGKTGNAGGEEAHHRTQTIRIARGGSVTPQVVDAPNLKLPSSKDAVANLLAIRPDPGPPPSEGMRSSRRSPNLQAPLVAPAPNVIRDYTRNGVAMEQVIAPAPTLSRTQPLTAPNLSAEIVPPAASVSREHTLVAPVMVPAVVPPAPNVSHTGSRSAPNLETAVVAPAPSVGPDKMRSAPSVTANVIPPAPGAASHEFSRAPVQATDVAVVPPPVSAPERAMTGNAKVSLPAPSVIAPPPGDVSRDVRGLASANTHDPFKAVVPPPPATASTSTGLLSSIIGKILGPTEVVQPPPSVNSSGGRTGTSPSLPSNVVAPPSSVGTGVAGSPARGTRNGAGASVDPNVVAPPSSSGVSGGMGTRASSAPTLGPTNVVAPPPSLAGSGGGTGTNGGGAGTPRGAQLANNIVPPPPSVGGGTNGTGSGLGRKGQGLGSPMDMGSNVAPPTAGSSATNGGVVLSSQPGSKVGLPSSGGAGALAMSPGGGDKVGLGGSGGGTGIGHGSGTGSGVAGEGTGAAKSGIGRGAETNARGGISPAPGPGGAGNAVSGTPPVPGVSVSGGSSMITLPSFGSDSDSGNSPSGKRSSLKQRQTFDVEVVATASSGGAFEPYKNLLHGEKHTIYPVATDSTVVMEYADENAVQRGFSGKLIAPQAIRAVMPTGLPRARMVVTCTLDTEGNLKNVRVLDPGPAEMTAKVIAALRAWKFQPALRGDKPVDVTAILGFGVDTNDRF